MAAGRSLRGYLPSRLPKKPRTRTAHRRRHVTFKFALLAVIIVLALVGPALTQYDPQRAAPLNAYEPPSAEHWFGTNSYGGDVFTRVVYAARLDLLIGFVSIAVSFAIAAPLGAVVGYSRSRWSGVTMRFMDFMQSFPIFILAMALVTVTGPSVTNVIVVLMILNVPIFVRLVRAEVLSIRERSFVEAGRCVGNSTLQLVGKYVLPNTVPLSVRLQSRSAGRFC